MRRILAMRRPLQRCMDHRRYRSLPRIAHLRRRWCKKRQDRLNLVYSTFQLWIFLCMPVKAWRRRKVAKFIWWLCQRAQSHRPIQNLPPQLLLPQQSPNLQMINKKVHNQAIPTNKIPTKSKYIQLIISTKNWLISNTSFMKMSDPSP